MSQLPGFLVSFSQPPAAKKHQKQDSCDIIKVPSYFATTLSHINLDIRNCNLRKICLHNQKKKSRKESKESQI